MPKPIFVVGVHRSGTTWLANILIQHTKISGVLNKERFGIYESAFFENIQDTFGNLEDENNFKKCIETFALTDFFILSGIDKSIFYKEQPKKYHELFRLLMDNIADRDNANLWLEKTPIHTLYLKEISKYYPDANFVAIKRNVIDTVKSTIKMHYFDPKKNKFVKPNIAPILYFTYRFVKYYKYIENFRRNSNSIMVIDYEQLKYSKEKVVSDICKFLEIDYQPQMLEEKFKPNTSFNNNSERKEILSDSDKKLITRIKPFFDIFPFRLYSIFNPIEKLIRKNKLPTWFYLITEEKKIEEDKKIDKEKLK